MDGLRLLVTGKTRSGKSTALHRLIRHALRLRWRRVLIMDGKGTELGDYANAEGVTYCAPNDDWVEPLEAAVADMRERYARLAALGLRRAPADWRVTLIVADEVQTATRKHGTGGKVKAALSLLFEQSAALGDVLILASQREIGSVPPTVRLNANARLQMLGMGFFRFIADGLPPTTGRVAMDAPLPPPTVPLDAEHITAVLARTHIEKARPPVTLYLGARGSGKTHALHNHPANAVRRVVYVDAATTSLRDALASVLAQCDAIAPTSAPIPDLLAMAKIALTSAPTLLLIDDLDTAPPRLARALSDLLEYAAEVAISGENATSAQQSRLELLIPRARVVELQPLPRDKAAALANEHLPDTLTPAQRAAAEARIWNLARGNPALTVALARRLQSASVDELRSLYTPRNHINIAWVLLLVAIVGLILLRYNMDSALAGAVLFTVLLVARRLFYSAMPRKR